MAKKYETETGLYVLVNGDGDVIAKSHVSPGIHLVTGRAYLSKSFDIRHGTDLSEHLSEEWLRDGWEDAETPKEYLDAILTSPKDGDGG